MGPPQGHKPCQQPCSGVSSSLHRSCQQPAPARAPHRVTASFGHATARVWGSPWAADGDLLHHGPPGLQGQSLPDNALLHGLQGNLCSSTWSTSSPLFCTGLGVCRVVSLTCSHSSLLAVVPQLLPFLKYVITEALPVSLVGSALAIRGSVSEPAGHWLCQTWGRLLAPSHRSHPCSPAATKTLPHKHNALCHALGSGMPYYFSVVSSTVHRR